MKSFFTWFFASMIGAAIGFGISWLTGVNVYLGIGIGVILGSSAGVTANIHRGEGEQVEHIKLNEQAKSTEMEAFDADTKSNESSERLVE